MAKGMTELELRQSVTAVAKLHATFWNGRSLPLSEDLSASYLDGELYE